MAAALARSSSVDEIVSAPGNPGMAELGETRGLDIEDPTAVVEAARDVGADLVVVGPEAPLVAGAADALEDDGRKVFGPRASAARIEGSKAFAKEILQRAGVPVPRWGSFDDAGKAVAFLDELGPPYVVKADGLAAGKGVVVTRDRDDAVAAVEDSLVRKSFGEAGSSIVIEEFLEGPETSLIAFSDGRNVLACEPAQDYKRVGDDDAGPNTGGMGSYSPVPACPPEIAHRIVSDVIEPVVGIMDQTGSQFTGALYAGLVLTEDGPRVLEFNARFGDPETQALLPRLESDFAELCLACANRELAGARLEFSRITCVSLVLASEGYPGSYYKGKTITGVAEAAALEGVEVYQAGTARRGGELVTHGGRVLAVSALAPTFAGARARAYEAADKIQFDGKHLRSDIALRAEEAEKEKL
jgi:phosphoribosylamine---glycine ligase